MVRFSRGEPGVDRPGREDTLVNEGRESIPHEVDAATAAHLLDAGLARARAS